MTRQELCRQMIDAFSEYDTAQTDCEKRITRERAERLELELAIEDQRQRFLRALGEDNKRFEFEVFRNLIAQRSPEQIRRMEEARGLR